MIAAIDATTVPDPDADGAPRCRRLFSVEQAAAHSGVLPKWVSHWIRTGRLESYRVRGGQLRIDEVELDECLASFDWLPWKPRSH